MKNEKNLAIAVTIELWLLLTYIYHNVYRNVLCTDGTFVLMVIFIRTIGTNRDIPILLLCTQ
jgi:hypothetical protein